MAKIFKICTAIFIFTFGMLIFTSNVANAKGWNENQVVVINQNLMNQKRYVQAKVRLKIYKTGLGLNKSRRFKVIMKDQSNRTIWEGERKTNDILGLGNDHAVYVIYLVDPKRGNLPFLADAISWSLEPVSGCVLRVC